MLCSKAFINLCNLLILNGHIYIHNEIIIIMKNSQKAELLRNFRPRSFNSIAEKKDNSKVEFIEFNNYKPLQALDPPADKMNDCSPATRLSQKAISLESADSGFFQKLPIDHDYIKKHLEIARNLGLLSIEKIKNERSQIPQLSKSKQLFVDIDETLCHTYYQDAKRDEDDIKVGGKEFISTRPYASEFLQKVSEHYDIIVKI